MPIPGDSALVVGDRETNQAESGGAQLNGAPPAPEDGAFGSLLSPVRVSTEHLDQLLRAASSTRD